MITLKNLKRLERELSVKYSSAITFDSLLNKLSNQKLEYISVIAAAIDNIAGKVICDYRMSSPLRSRCDYDASKDILSKYEGKILNTFEEITAFHLQTGVMLWLFFNCIWYKGRLYTGAGKIINCDNTEAMADLRQAERAFT